MKFGVRKPSVKRRVAARTSVKRVARHKLGLRMPKGGGFITDPKRAVSNRIYSRTSVSVDQLLKGGTRASPNRTRGGASSGKSDAGGRLAVPLALLFGGLALWLNASIITAIILGSIALFVGIAASVQVNNNAAKPLQKRDSESHFNPTNPAFQPADLCFDVAELPAEIVTAPGGPGGIESDKYRLDLAHTQCSCDGWKRRRSLAEVDPRRLCRHLVNALRRRDLIHGTEKWSKAVIDNGEGVPLKAWVVRLQTAPDVLVSLGDNDDWLNVFAHQQLSGERIAEASGPITRCGWSLTENRWAYGVRVPGAGELRKLLREAT